MLSDVVALRIREAVALGGKALDGKLPEHENHEKRNPYAHIWREIKNEMGMTYKECDDSDEEKILNIVRKLVENPS